MAVASPFAMTVMPPLVKPPVSSPVVVIIIIIVKGGKAKERKAEAKAKGAVRIAPIVKVIIVTGPTVAVAAPPAAMPAVNFLDQTFVQLRYGGMARRQAAGKRTGRGRRHQGKTADDSRCSQIGQLFHWDVPLLKLAPPWRPSTLAQ
jgi:hypothetical protein